MAIKHLTYLDLTPAQRREGATVARERLQASLGTPFLNQDQRQVVLAEMARVVDWEAGRLPVIHTVEVVDSVPVEAETD